MIAIYREVDELKTNDRVWKILLKQAKKVRQGELFIKPKFLKDGGFHE